MSEGMRTAGDQHAIEEARREPDRQCRRDGEDRRHLVEDEPAGDHRAEAAHRGERKVELRDREGDREADGEDREEAHLLQHVQQIGRREEVVRREREEHEQRERRERGAVRGDEVPRPTHAADVMASAAAFMVR